MSLPDDVDGPTSAVAPLADRYGLDRVARHRLGLLLNLLTEDPLAPTSIRTRDAVLDDHLADSLVALDSPAIQRARSVLDLGSGAGLPGLPLAISLPETMFALLDSSSRKVGFVERAVEFCGLANVEVVHGRAESFADGGHRYDVVTARAVASLPVVLEYAAPLLRMGGTLIVWRGQRDPELEASASRAAAVLGLGPPTIEPVRPYPRAEHRHLYVTAKLEETPSRFPRRPGLALKRPLGTLGPRRRASSDRVQR